jgi:hypothetical protein
MNVENPNYAFMTGTGTLFVYRCQVSVDNIVTEYTYDEGNPIVPFNWEENIVGYNKYATDNSFSYSLEYKNGDEYQPINQMINAGEYRMTIKIVHTHGFEFVKNANVTYDLQVVKKDISDEINVYNVPEDGQATYDPFGFVPGVELNEKYSYINYVEVMYYNETEEVYLAKNVGRFIYMVEIDDDNYTGYKVAEFEIVKADLSNKIEFEIDNNGYIVLEGNTDVDVTVPDNALYTVIYTKLGDSETVVDEITEIGNYKVKVIVNDNSYYGEKEIAFTVIESVRAKIEELERLITVFENADIK